MAVHWLVPAARDVSFGSQAAQDGDLRDVTEPGRRAAAHQRALAQPHARRTRPTAALDHQITAAAAPATAAAAAQHRHQIHARCTSTGV